MVKSLKGECFSNENLFYFAHASHLICMYLILEIEFDKSETCQSYSVYLEIPTVIKNVSSSITLIILNKIT